MKDDTRQYRVAIWSAVSSKPQASEEKTSLRDQERMGREFAAAINGLVTHLFSVPGHSRDYVLWSEAEAEMPAYRELRRAVDGHEFDVLYAVDVDRLGRDPALCEQVISLVDRSGAEVYLASSPHVIGQKMMGHRYLSAIQAVRAGEDQQIRVARQRRGIRGRIARGLAANNWPYGYRPTRNAAGKTVGAEFNDNAPAMRLATERFLRGDSYLRIAAALDAAGYHSPTGHAWNHTTVHRQLHNDTYAGRPGWGGYITDGTSVHFPALWDEPTYLAVQRERENRAGQWRRRETNGPYLGVVFCVRCGVRMTRTRNQRGMVYLHCPTHRQRTRTGTDCHPNYIQERHVAQAIRETLELITTPEKIEETVARMQPDHRLQEQIEEADYRLTAIDERRQRLALALAGGQMDAAMYRRTDDALLEELHHAQDIRADIARQLTLAPDPAQRREALQIVRAGLDTLFFLPSLELNTLLRNIGLRVLVEAGNITTIKIV